MNVHQQGRETTAASQINAGIDVCKQWLDACWGDRSQRFNHDAEGIRELAAALLEAIGKAPAILITDEDGIVRWHSAGLTPDPTAKIDNEAVYTMNAAILFALEIAAPKAAK